jgi:Fe2+ or Zn2+ uptake regulation protein
MNIQSLINAIDDYEFYTPGQREVLKVMVTIAVDNIVEASINYLKDKANVTKPTVYSAIKTLEADNAISIITSKTSRHNLYKLNDEKLSHIIKLYNNKKSI